MRISSRMMARSWSQRGRLREEQVVVIVAASRMTAGAGATCSITGAGAAQATAGAATCSINVAGAAWGTGGAGSTYSLTVEGAA